MQVKTLEERVKKQEDIIEQLREEASSQANTSMLHNELMDLEKVLIGGKVNGASEFFSG